MVSSAAGRAVRKRRSAPGPENMGLSPRRRRGVRTLRLPCRDSRGSGDSRVGRRGRAGCARPISIGFRVAWVRFHGRPQGRPRSRSVRVTSRTRAASWTTVSSVGVGGTRLRHRHATSSGLLLRNQQPLVRRSWILRERQASVVRFIVLVSGLSGRFPLAVRETARLRGRRSYVKGRGFRESVSAWLEGCSWARGAGP
jgi:hypothetical protein